MALRVRERHAASMVTVRTWLTHDRPHPPVDRIFDAACDVMLATRTFESETVRRPEDPPSLAATLGVLDASLRTLKSSLPYLAARAPAGTSDESTLRALLRAEAALADAADACDAARNSVLSEHEPGSRAASSRPARDATAPVAADRGGSAGRG